MIASVAVSAAILGYLYWSRRRRVDAGGRTTVTVRHGINTGARRQLDDVEFLTQSDIQTFGPPVFIWHQFWSELVAYSVIAALVATGAFFSLRSTDGSGAVVVEALFLIGLPLSMFVTWQWSRWRDVQQRLRAIKELCEHGAVTQSTQLRAHTLKMPKQFGTHYILVATWTDRQGRSWDTRCGPFFKDPVAFFGISPVQILCDLNDPTASIVDPRHLPKLSWFGGLSAHR